MNLFGTARRFDLTPENISSRRIGLLMIGITNSKQRIGSLVHASRVVRVKSIATVQQEAMLNPVHGNHLEPVMSFFVAKVPTITTKLRRVNHQSQTLD